MLTIQLGQDRKEQIVIYEQDKKKELQELLKEQGKIKTSLFAAEEQWLDCQEQLDSLEVDTWASLYMKAFYANWL